MMDPADALSVYPLALQQRLRSIHDLIFEVAESASDVGQLERSLKWGQLSFATQPKTGTPIRIAGKGNTYSVFVPCATSLISDFREAHPDWFEYHGSRELRFSLDQPLPRDKLRKFLLAALTYYSARGASPR